MKTLVLFGLAAVAVGALIAWSINSFAAGPKRTPLDGGSLYVTQLGRDEYVTSKTPQTFEVFGAGFEAFVADPANNPVRILIGDKRAIVTHTADAGWAIEILDPSVRVTYRGKR